MLNWKTGLFRIWVLISASWALFVIGMSLFTVQDTLHFRAKNLAQWESLQTSYCLPEHESNSAEYDAEYCATIEDSLHRAKNEGLPFSAFALVVVIGFVIVPPVGVFLFGIIVFWLLKWIVSGFRG